jgi:hypothetical protein
LALSCGFWGCWGRTRGRKGERGRAKSGWFVYGGGRARPPDRSGPIKAGEGGRAEREKGDLGEGWSQADAFGPVTGTDLAVRRLLRYQFAWL